MPRSNALYGPAMHQFESIYYAIYPLLLPVLMHSLQLAHLLYFWNLRHWHTHAEKSQGTWDENTISAVHLSCTVYSCTTKGKCVNGHEHEHSLSLSVKYTQTAPSYIPAQPYTYGHERTSSGTRTRTPQGESLLLLVRVITSVQEEPQAFTEMLITF